MWIMHSILVVLLLAKLLFLLKAMLLTVLILFSLSRSRCSLSKKTQFKGCSGFDLEQPFLFVSFIFISYSLYTS